MVIHQKMLNLAKAQLLFIKYPFLMRIVHKSTAAVAYITSLATTLSLIVKIHASRLQFIGWGTGMTSSDCSHQIFIFARVPAP